MLLSDDQLPSQHYFRKGLMLSTGSVHEQAAGKTLAVLRAQRSNPGYTSS
jgi:hypothetical protein